LTGVELNLQRALKIWWCLFWRTTVLSIFIGITVGLLIGTVLGSAGFSIETIERSGQVVGACLGALAGFFMTWAALAKEYSDFRIVLVPIEPPSKDDA
jgi:hypothetical protein